MSPTQTLRKVRSLALSAAPHMKAKFFSTGRARSQKSKSQLCTRTMERSIRFRSRQRRCQRSKVVVARVATTFYLACSSSSSATTHGGSMACNSRHTTGSCTISPYPRRNARVHDHRGAEAAHSLQAGCGCSFGCVTHR